MDMRTELAIERARLAKADRHIRQGQARVDGQAALVIGLRGRSGDARDAERLLATFEHTMADWRAHRALILQRIAHLEARAASEDAAARTAGPG